LADVFISYSRKDKAFVERLAAALTSRERDAWVDWEGIAPTAEWLKEIYAGIEGASAFVAICTPDWIASEICAKELDHAIASNKRIVPIVSRDIEARSAPPALARLNWIFIRDSDDFDIGIAAVLTAIDTDFEWVGQHTRVLVRASEWKAQARERSLLLRGANLKAAESWLVQAGQGTRPDATELQREYLLASRRETTRRQRWLTGGLGGLTALAIVAAVLAVINAKQARIEAAAALSRQLAAQSTMARTERADLLPRALLLATEAMLRAPTPALEADQALRSLLAQMPRHLSALPTGANRLGLLGLSRDGLSAAWALNGEIRLWHVGDPAGKVQVLAASGDVDQIEFDATGQVLLTRGGRKSVRLHEVHSGRQIGELTLPGQQVIAAAVAARGEHVALLTGEGQLHLLDASGLPQGTFAVDVYETSDPHILIRFSPDNHALAVSSVRGLWLCRLSAPSPCTAPVLSSISDRTALEFSPDGRLLAVDSASSKLQVFDIEAMTTPLAEIERPTGRALLRFSPDSQWLAVGSTSATEVQVWDPRQRHVIARFPLGGTLVALDIAADSQRLAASSSNGTAEVWRLPDSRRQAQLSQGGPLAFVGDGSRVLTAGDGDILHLWEAVARADSARLAAEGDEFRFDTKGSTLVAASAQDPGPATIVRWSAADGRTDRLAVAGLRRIMLSDDGRRAWAARGDTVTAWDVESLGMVSSASHAPPIDWQAFLPELQRRRCSYRDVPCRDRVAMLATKGSVQVTAVSPDGRFAATERADEVARVWLAGADQPVVSLPNARVYALTVEAAVLGVMPREEWGHEGGGPVDLRIHALPGGVEIARLNQADGIREATLSPDGRRLLLVSQGYVQTMLELPSGRALWQRPGSSWPLRWAFSGNGQRLAITQPASGGAHDSLVVVEVASGRPIGEPIPTPDGVLVLGLGSDGSRVARGSHRDVVVHETSTGREIVRVQHAQPAVDVTFSHDQTMLVSASEDATVRLVDLRLGREIARLMPDERPKRVRVSPDDALVAVGSDTGVQVFAWRIADLVAEACRRVSRDLQADEWRLYLGDSPAQACRSIGLR
jgi:WD40 repeat protein